MSSPSQADAALAAWERATADGWEARLEEDWAAAAPPAEAEVRFEMAYRTRISAALNPLKEPAEAEVRFEMAYRDIYGL